MAAWRLRFLNSSKDTREWQLDIESPHVFVLGVYGAIGGALLAVFGRLFTMIFWETAFPDFPTLMVNMVCGAALGAILLIFIALLFDTFRRRNRK